MLGAAVHYSTGVSSYVLRSSSSTTHPLSGQAGIFRHVLISAERSFIMKNGRGGGAGKEANIRVKDGIHIQIPAERRESERDVRWRPITEPGAG